MHPTAGQPSRRGSARSSRFPKSVACIIATSTGPRSPTPVTFHRHQRAPSAPLFFLAVRPLLRISSHRVSPPAGGCRKPYLLPASTAWSMSAEHGRASSEPGPLFALPQQEPSTTEVDEDLRQSRRATPTVP